ncbi:MAG: hypothetical protein P4L76_00020 [Beijerinckiaceae bacterium]|nr:hypothetical protein [Beijerinckiaceae bacterium]
MDGRSLSRRTILQGSLAALCVPAAADAISYPISQAESFVDSVGVNTHLSSEPYASLYDRFRALIGASGIRHLRDELRASNDLALWSDLFETFGIRSQMLVSPSTNTVSEMSSYIQALGVSRLSAIEGQNEGDSDWFMANSAARGDWSKTTVDYQRAIYEAARQRYSASLLPIVSPSIIDWKPDDVKLIGGAASYCDVVAIHPYVQRGQEPESRDDYASLSWYIKNIRDRFKPGAPVMATETGYSTIIRATGAGVPEDVAAAYLPRLLINNFGAGVRRTFLYEFMDGGTDPSNSEHHWGLIHNDGTPKPAYQTIRLLLQVLKGANEPIAPESPFDARIVQAPAATRCHGFLTRNGALILAVWREVRLWDPVAMTKIDVAAEPVTISYDRLTKISYLRLSPNSTWSAGDQTSGSCVIPVGGNIVLIKFQRRTP